MAWKVLDVVTRNFRSKPHRFMEFESDDPDELVELCRKAEEKGWTEYVRGTRVGAAGVDVVIMLKPA